MNAIANALFITLLLSTWGGQVLAQSSNAADKLAITERLIPVTALSPEVLSAKTLLEDLIVKRYSQELATRINREAFSVNAQLELLMVAPEEIKAVEPISDLMLGTIDPEALIKKFTGSGANDATAAILNQYRIRSVNLSAGLRPELGEEKRTEIANLLGARLRAEFNNNGKAEVSFIQSAPLPVPEGPMPKTWLDWLKELQDLAGQIVLALALLMGALLWGLFGKPKAEGSQAMNMNVNTADGATKSEGQRANEMLVALEKRQKEQESFLKDIQALSEQLSAIFPRVSDGLEAIVRTWCQQGDSGRVRLACFAEAVGGDLGKMPIPIDAAADLTKIFAQMPSLSLKEKRDALQRAYWDLLAALNLGPESLNQPFSYMGGLNVETVNKVLMQQNPKMRTLVALYLPEDLRSRYLQSLDQDSKRELLSTAADLQYIPSQDLKSFDSNLGQQIRSAGKDQGDMIELEFTLQKVVAGLSPVEEVTMLANLKGPGVDAFKRKTASLAFLDQWPDDPLSKLITRANVDEIVAFLRLRSELNDRILQLSPPLTAQMVKDELSRTDNLGENEKNRLLERLVEHIRNLQEEKEIDLETIFAAQNPILEESNAA